MNLDLADHIAALVVDAVSRQGDTYSLFIEDLPAFVENTFGLRVDRALIDLAVTRLENLGGLRRYSSSLTGDLLEISVSRSLLFFSGEAPHPGPNTTVEYDKLYDSAQVDFRPIWAYHFGKGKWVDRVVANLAAGKIDEVQGLSEEEARTPVPAADRIVRLDHNQQTEITRAADAVIDGVSAENAIGGDPTLRERFIAQLRAGKELVDAQSVRAFLIYEMWVKMLGTLIIQYKDKAIGEAAKKLLGLLIEHIFGK